MIIYFIFISDHRKKRLSKARRNQRRRKQRIRKSRKKKRNRRKRKARKAKRRKQRKYPAPAAMTVTAIQTSKRSGQRRLARKIHSKNPHHFHLQKITVQLGPTMNHKSVPSIAIRLDYLQKISVTLYCLVKELPWLVHIPFLKAII